MCAAYTIYHNLYVKNISPRFSKNSEADASEFLENLKDMYPGYYMPSDVCDRLTIVNHC